MKAGIFWPTEQPQNHTAKYIGARAVIETWLIILSCFKKKKKIRVDDQKSNPGPN